jgi:hypothetical protein
LDTSREESLVKKQGLFIFITCVLVSAVSGCHDPVNGVVMVADSSDHPSAEYAETHGKVEFRSDSEKYPNFEITAPPNVCAEGTTLPGTNKQAAVCHIRSDVHEGQYTFTVVQKDPQGNPSPIPPPVIPYNIKQCPSPCKW